MAALYEEGGSLGALGSLQAPDGDIQRYKDMAGGDDPTSRRR